MAVNNDINHPLHAVNDTSVKFFSSLTRNQARGIDSFIYGGEECTIDDFPGAICYVSDSGGNSIFLNKLLFGDGATPGSGGGGGGGITEVSLDIIPVVELNGQVLKTLADYFSADGTFITEGINIVKTAQDGTLINVISITENGITIGNDTVITQTYFNTQKGLIEQDIAAAEQSAKDYADSLVSSVYTVKGSKDTYSDLVAIQNPKTGDVWNVKAEIKNTQTDTVIPAGTNFVWNGTEWDPLGGTFDVSNFYTKSEVEAKISEAETRANNYTDGQINTLSASVLANTNAIGSLSTSVTTNAQNIATNAQNIATNTQNITQNTTNITNISTQLTWQ